MDNKDRKTEEFKPSPPWEHKPADTDLVIPESRSGTADAGGGYGGYGEPLVKPLPPPIRLVFGDMAGVVFLVWFPIMAALLIPWTNWLSMDPMVIGFGKNAMVISLVQLIVPLIIAFPPWIVLMIHLKRGRLWDGILDMFLWAIWESLIMIIMCYLYPGHTEKLIWHASLYWGTMSHWIATGIGPEGEPGVFIWIHLKHLVAVAVGAIILGLPALVLGVLQLNYMNFYVAQCMVLSDNALLTLPIAWHFWSVVRVMGFITISSSLFQMTLKGFKAPARWSVVWWGVIIGIILVAADMVLKAVYAEDIRIILKMLTGL